MRINLIEILLAVLVILLISTAMYVKFKYKKVNVKKYQKKWNNLQRMCSDKKLWYQAIIEADTLLDEALKKRHFHGKTTGERLVSAQNIFSENSDVWFAHKFKNKISENHITKITKKDTVKALKGIRNALRDLDALPNSNTKGLDK